MSEQDPEIQPEDAPHEDATEEAAETAAGPNAIESATAFVREHPVLTVAGGIVIGLVAGALLPRGAGRKAARRAVQAAEIASATGLAFGRNAWDRAEAAGSDLRERGSAVADRLGGYGESAADQAGRLLGSAEQAKTRAGRTIAKKAKELRSKVGR